MTKSILIIDDESSIRWILKVTFEEYSIKIFEAMTAKEGVEIANQIHPDLIIMDYKLPDLNGWEAASIIRKTIKETPIIGHTGYASIEDIKKGLDLGCTEILSKPVNLDQWEQLISKYLKISF